MIVYRCDLCGEIRECSQRLIEQMEYDICSECWSTLMAKLKDKGRRPKAKRETVLLPSPIIPETSHEPEHPFPSRPPDITAESWLTN